MNFLFKIAIITSLFAFISTTTFNNSIAQEYNDDEFEQEFSEDFEELNDTENKNTNNDPFEKVNRKIFVFNENFDKYFFEHVARTYRLVLPKQARSSIRNFLNNISIPITVVNSIAQGKVDNSVAGISNFLINSTIGIFGIFDVADAHGIRYEKEDFGQTLGHYGVKSGIYLVIPFRGPSSTRDFSGWIVDNSISPTGFNYLRVGQKENYIANKYRIGLGVMSAVDSRESLLNVIDDIRKDSFDPYVTIRSAYFQNREAKVKK